MSLRMLDPGQSQSRFRLALIIALALHAAIILGLSFDQTRSERYLAPQLEVTLAKRPAQQAVTDSPRRAQTDQQGSGNEALQERMTRSSDTTPAMAQTPSTSDGAQVTAAPGAGPRAVSTSAQTRARLLSARDSFSATDTLESKPWQAEQYTVLNNLEGRLADTNLSDVNAARTHRLTALSARSAVDAAYLEAWRQRVESVGNRFYPEASIRYGIYGQLRMLVVVDHSGQLEDIRILESSGYALLDEAATKIVRMAAPYPPFPAALRASTDTLEIVRTWQFQQNRLSSD